jgi:hypothetical protein
MLLCFAVVENKFYKFLSRLAIICCTTIKLLHKVIRINIDIDLFLPCSVRSQSIERVAYLGG